MPNLSIRSRLLVALVMIVAVGGGIQAAGHLKAWSHLTTLQARSAALLDLRDLAHQLDRSVSAQHSSVSTYLLSGSLEALDAYHAARIDEAELVGSSAAIVARFPEVSLDLEALATATSSWRTQFLNPTVDLVQSGRPAEAGSAGNVAEGEALFRDVADARDGFEEHVASLSAAAVSDLQAIVGDQAVTFLLALTGAFLVVAAAVWLLTRWIVRPLKDLLATARLVESGQDVAFVAGNDDEIGRLGGALERMRAGLYSQAIEGSVVNRYTELTAFVEADGDLARATLDALDELVEPDDGAIHVSNRSKDRALPEGSIGDIAPEIVSLGQLTNCPGVRRSSLYVSDNLAERLSVRCPLYPTTSGTLACMPLIALGEVVGVVHLHWTAIDALPLNVRGAAARITEHASLAIANRRLMTALQGMASTDGRTGLANSRSFDEMLEGRLANRDKSEPLALLMLDIDHFKAFNDRNGHPAGDQALRAFSQVLQAAVREGDVAARYGGEEFVVMLPGADLAAATAVAERIRSQVEATTIDLSPGHRDQVTVSIGLAMWPHDAEDRVKLLEVADAALYRAKKAGRNRVVIAGESFAERTTPGRSRRAGHGEPGTDTDTIPTPIALPRAG